MLSIKRKGTTLSHAILAILLVSSGLNVALAIRVSQQRGAIEARTAQQPSPVGGHMRSLDGHDRDGNRVKIDFSADGRPTVLYVFQPGCGWCARNSQPIRELAGLAGSRNRFVAVSLVDAGLDEYVEEHPLPFEVISGIDPELVETYNLAGTPRTLVIAPDGTVLRNWVGAYTGDLRDEIAGYFDADIREAQVEAP